MTRFDYSFGIEQFHRNSFTGTGNSFTSFTGTATLSKDTPFTGTATLSKDTQR